MFVGRRARKRHFKTETTRLYGTQTKKATLFSAFIPTWPAIGTVFVTLSQDRHSISPLFAAPLQLGHAIRTLFATLVRSGHPILTLFATLVRPRGSIGTLFVAL